MDHNCQAGLSRTETRRSSFLTQDVLLRVAATALAAALLCFAVTARAEVPASSRAYFDQILDIDGNGLEDVLDQWLEGELAWPDLRHDAVAYAAETRAQQSAPDTPPMDKLMETGFWSAGQVRLICLGRLQEDLTEALDIGRSAGICDVVHSVDRFGGFTVIAADEDGLGALLSARPSGRYLLDRDGVPALDISRGLVGADRAQTGTWRLGQDWSGTVAVLDSGCDTAHGDLGDASDDDIDGPPPAVGDNADWYPADTGWPVYAGYKVVGWHDVTDDFSGAVGPWDYHHHGTALAAVACGAGNVETDFRGMAPKGRLTVVKFYDFDETWHVWAGDFLAACAWTLDNAEMYRIRVALMAVNWETDAGISDAVDALLNAGILPVAAMGNFGTDDAGPGYPALTASALTVGGINDSGAVSAFSGRGLPDQNKPDLLAPAGGLLPEFGRIHTADNEPQDTYSDRQGTSLAAAHAAGAAYLLTDAMHQNAIPLPTSAMDVKILQAVLKATAARVDLQETSDGLDTTALPAYSGPDAVRGWGLLRIDAAADAMLLPLQPGQDQIDTLQSGWLKPVVARRLQTNRDIRYQVEAIPTSGLDVALEIIDPRWIMDPWRTDQIIRRDENAAGVSEFTYLHGAAESWQIVVVKKISGEGLVTLRLREADSFPDQGSTLTLPGRLTGTPNWGHLGGNSSPSLVVPSLVEVDQVARSVNVLDTMGNASAGWPVYLFPHVSAQGGLNQPLLWDMDGQVGDEIVLSGDFGSVYFFNNIGAFTRVELHFNRPLTSPVGLAAADGQRRVAVADKLGRLRIWSHGPVLEVDQETGHTDPFQPAVGQLQIAGGEEMVIVFADGHVQAMAADGGMLAGWPLDLAGTPVTDPVLCDLDDDGRHDVILPVRNDGGAVVMRVFDGQGQPLPQDGAVLAPTSGGNWLVHSPPAVVGRYGTDDLRVVMTSLQDNGLSGQDLAWSLSRLTAFADGGATVSTLPGFGFSPLANESVLSLESTVLAPPVAWNAVGGTGADPATLVSVRWRDYLFGLTSVSGCSIALYQPSPDGLPLSVRRPVSIGGVLAEGAASGGLMVLPLQPGVDLLAVAVDDALSLMPVTNSNSFEPLWSASRADSRNTGAYPLRTYVSTQPIAAPTKLSLMVWPNPGSGNFRFQLGDDVQTMTQLEIFDLRGRLVRRLPAVVTRDLAWDGRDAAGRDVAAGTYLVQARRGDQRTTTRVVVTR